MFVIKKTTVRATETPRKAIYFRPINREALLDSVPFVEDIKLLTSSKSLSKTENDTSINDVNIINSNQSATYPSKKIAPLVSRNAIAVLSDHEILRKEERASFAAAVIAAILWVASIYGISSFATGVNELLIPPIIMYALAAVLCVGLIFVDMEFLEGTGFVAGLFYFLTFLGVVAKLAAAAILLYCFLVVFSYYKETQSVTSVPSNSE